MSDWRPGDWDTIREGYMEKVQRKWDKGVYVPARITFEAGADAMFKAIQEGKASVSIDMSVAI